MIDLAQNLIHDFRFSLRLIKRSRLIALGVVISLALGIGATGSVFSLLDFILFRPLPVPESEPRGSPQELHANEFNKFFLS